MDRAPYYDATEQGQEQPNQRIEKSPQQQPEAVYASSSTEPAQAHEAETERKHSSTGGKLKEWKDRKTEEFRAWQASKPRAPQQATTEQLNYMTNIWQEDAPGGRNGQPVVRIAKK